MKLIYISLLLLLTNISVPHAFSTTAETKIEISRIGSASDAWKKNISTLTVEPLWNARDAYDASNTLMIPMHFAFVAGDKKGIKQFETLMSRFASQELPGGRLNQAQWIYFVSRYLALRSEFDYPLTRNNIYLAQRVSAWLHSRWMFEPALQWGHLPLIGSKSRLRLAQSNSEVWPLSYYPAITDYELFLFSIAGDISFINKKNPEALKELSSEIKSSVRELIASGISVVRSRGKFSETGGWLFQQGMWTDHPDFRFAGHSELRTDLGEWRVKDIAEDSSHSHRWPLFFRSMIMGTEQQANDREYLIRAYQGFSNQLVEHVITIRGTSVLLKNYMDGKNGLYRYRYSTVGSNSDLGYGPYGLSGTLGISWYPFAAKTDSIYERYANSYPLPENVLNLYVGPNTTRARNPLIEWPAFFTNGFAELIAKHGLYLSKNYNLNVEKAHNSLLH
ncbi:hypothetical protein [Pseudomonas sp. BBP2017]|uniref:hypothetical protein n=1 Tax=Pseudomonas sp. BBP2017 TaxID=2109731 RepID=UPI0011B28D35|nr:hypothetical protein [Pseudomonas sp. BBP2017]